MIFFRFFKQGFAFLLCLLMLLSSAFAQISPPGMGDAQTASWFAIGARQDLNSKKSWQSMTYIGLGRKSNPDNTNLLYKPAMVVLNQEFYHPFAKNWQTSVAVSYRRQQEYAAAAPYLETHPQLQQEFRVYGRIAKSFAVKWFRITPTLRQEIRRFFTPDFTNSAEPLQLRSRFRLQLATPLDPKKKHKITISSEQLLSTSQANTSRKWSTFAYKESRFMLYYSYSPSTLPWTFDIGYMNNLIKEDASTSSMVHYLAFDLILKNPFGHSTAP
ncbi:DUF2490 domain-containing protein [Sphingobacterium oryzagri]|uniref:DUF2490 domain-containing protein n=1 Tax=Sphingobacterium oryzagri TaxID=3025669 RepID=A0ABY7WG84_9SPHI|nr:DUF2490 domain-containing protein [Sphingobacterium sp. KACC 22765]WDF68631.1 DUF2490 domain-containing protein [Sphingobacterium sp. KACC 22765]